MVSSKIISNTKFTNLFANYLNSLATNGMQGGEIIYEARNMIFRDNIGNIDFSVKCFRQPHLFNRIIYSFFRKSKARRSFENAQQLEKLKIGTAQPIAYIENYNYGLLATSYYVCGYLKECADLRWWERKNDRVEVLEHAGKFIGELHSKGVWHKDFSPGNILYDNNWNFYLIDINRMQFDVKCIGKLMQNFKCLHDEPSETADIARYYCPYSPFKARSEAEIVKLALDARATYKAAQARKKRFKAIFKRNIE
ncbi:MAG: lipopolysaccharide kinase InaA family protein [Muribaculaceae bacterium]|nr:lipopolysaccharide kinase InaA family protein [Muribaculaceae bacterium]